MNYHMQLVERGGANVSKKAFIRWRDNGIAFKVTEDDLNLEDLSDNITLINEDGKGAGYWGDIGTGPFLCYGKSNFLHEY